MTPQREVGVASIRDISEPSTGVGRQNSSLGLASLLVGERTSIVLGEFFAARPDELDDSLIEDGPYGRLQTVEAKGLSPVTIATLGELLGAGSYDELVDRAAEGPQAETEEAGVLTVPTEVRDALATANDLPPVSAAWVATEELSLDGWESQEALEVLRELAELAREARRARRELWYWWSL